MQRKMTFISNRNNIHILLRIISVFFLIALFSGNIKSQESGKGCTDPAAKNYDITASVNNGSCTYKTTVYNPPFKYLLPEEVQETSGLTGKPEQSLQESHLPMRVTPTGRLWPRMKNMCISVTSVTTEEHEMICTC